MLVLVHGIVAPVALAMVVEGALQLHAICVYMQTICVPGLLCMGAGVQNAREC